MSRDPISKEEGSLVVQLAVHIVALVQVQVMVKCPFPVVGVVAPSIKIEVKIEVRVALRVGVPLA